MRVRKVGGAAAPSLPPPPPISQLISLIIQQRRLCIVFLVPPCLCWNFKKSMGARNLVTKNRVVVPAHQATRPGGIGSLVSILGLLISLKIRALVTTMLCAREFLVGHHVAELGKFDLARPVRVVLNTTPTICLYNFNWCSKNMVLETKSHSFYIVLTLLYITYQKLCSTTSFMSSSICQSRAGRFRRTLAN